MAIESLNDRIEYVNVFGVATTIDGSALTAIFDNAYIDQLDIGETQPILTVPTEWLSAATYNSSVVVSSASFSGTIREIRSDGTGYSIVVLKDI